MSHSRHTEDATRMFMFAMMGSIGSVLVNLLSAWFQQDVLHNSFPPVRIAIIGGLLVVVLVISILLQQPSKPSSKPESPKPHRRSSLVSRQSKLASAKRRSVPAAQRYIPRVRDIVAGILSAMPNVAVFLWLGSPDRLGTNSLVGIFALSFLMGIFAAFLSGRRGNDVLIPAFIGCIVSSIAFVGPPTGERIIETFFYELLWPLGAITYLGMSKSGKKRRQKKM